MEEEKTHNQSMQKNCMSADGFLTSIRRDLMRKTTFPMSDFWYQFIEEYTVLEYLTSHIKKTFKSSQSEIETIISDMISNEKTIASIMLRVRKFPRKSLFEDFVDLFTAYYRQTVLGKRTEYAKTEKKKEKYKATHRSRVEQDNSPYKSLMEIEREEMLAILLPRVIKLLLFNTDAKFCRKLAISIVMLYGEKKLPAKEKQEFGGKENYDKNIVPMLTQKFCKIHKANIKCPCFKKEENKSYLEYKDAVENWYKAKKFLADELGGDFELYFVD